MIIHDVPPYFVTKKAAELFGYDSPEELMNSIDDIEKLFHEKHRLSFALKNGKIIYIDIKYII